jgi:hypothetical protein
MTTEHDAARRSRAITICVVLVGLGALWLGQPFWPGWGCAASLPGICNPHVLPVRVSFISAGILLALLAAVVILPALPGPGSRWVLGLPRFAMLSVPAVLVVTVIAHFTIPQP